MSAEDPMPEAPDELDEESPLARRLAIRKAGTPRAARRRTTLIALVMNAVTLAIVVIALWGPWPGKDSSAPMPAAPSASGGAAHPGRTAQLVTPAAPATHATLTITVRGDLPARVYVDGQLAGTAPLPKLAVALGRHVLEASCGEAESDKRGPAVSVDVDAAGATVELSCPAQP